MSQVGQFSEIAQKFGSSEKDTGRPEVQIAILTKKIADLSPHFEAHKKDHHSKRGLLRMIGKRRALLKYLNRENHDRYNVVIKELGLRK